MAVDGIDVAGSMGAHGDAASLIAGAPPDTVVVQENEVAPDATVALDTVDADRVPDEVARLPEGPMSYGLEGLNYDCHAEDRGVSGGLRP